MRKFFTIISLMIVSILTSCNVNTDNVVKFKKVSFGTMNEKPISWYVISDEDDKQVLLSEKVLDTKRYNDTLEHRDWENTTLHEYLNTEFVNTYFSKEDKERLLFINDIDSDVVTMLTINDMLDLFGEMNYLHDGFYNNKKEFLANKKIIAKPSEQALYNEIEVFDNEVYAKVMQEKKVDKRYDFANGHSAYWLLNQVDDKAEAYCVTANGFISSTEVDRDYVGIRPVIRVKK